MVHRNPPMLGMLAQVRGPAPEHGARELWHSALHQGARWQRPPHCMAISPSPLSRALTTFCHWQVDAQTSIFWRQLAFRGGAERAEDAACGEGVWTSP